MAAENRGIFRFIDAAQFSKQGLIAAYQHEEAFRQEVWLCLVLVPLSFIFADTGVELALMLGSLIFVLIVELLNSAVEATVDRIGVEKHELSGRAKDIGSAAVSLALINVVIVWACVIFI